MKMNKLFIIGLFGLSLLISCGKPNHPESIVPDDTSGGYKIEKKITTAGYAQDVLLKDNLLYISQGEGGLMIVDVTDPLNPETVSITTENMQGYSNRLAMQDSILYISAGTNGTFVVNVSDPFAPFRVEVSSPFKPARVVHVFRGYLFTSVSENGVKLSEISYPSEPDPRGSIPTPGYAYGMANTADSNYLMVACGEMGLAVYDIYRLKEGFGPYQQVGWCDTPGYAEEVAVDDARSLAFMTCGTAGLQIIDYSDTTNIHITGFYDGSGYAKSLIYKDQRVFVAAELSGLQVVDVSNPANPTLIGEIDTDFAWALDMDEKYIYLADDKEGVLVISIPD
jgi:hypothetical protein